MTSAVISILGGCLIGYAISPLRWNRAIIAIAGQLIYGIGIALSGGFQ